MSAESVDSWSQSVILLGVLSGFRENTTYDRSDTGGMDERCLEFNGSVYSK
jgi:hypothetical protein